MPEGIVDALVEEAGRNGPGFAAWGVAWARIAPTVLFVPAFGLGVLPVALRIAIGFSLAVAVAPAVHPAGALVGPAWPAALLREAAFGIPVAIAASVPVWAATVAGGVADTAIFGRLGAGRRSFARDATPLGTLLGIAVSVVWLRGPGLTEAVTALGRPEPGGAWSRAVFELAAGLDVGCAVGAPLLVVALLVDLATLVAARESAVLRSPAVARPLRALVVLLGAAALLDRMAAALSGR
jgi:type III secretory pathway component EscT